MNDDDDFAGHVEAARIAKELLEELGGMQALQVAGIIIFMLAIHKDNADPEEFMTTIFDSMRKRVRQATYDA